MSTEPVQAKVDDAGEPIEPCPTPLAWQDVVRAVAEGSESWSLSVDGVTVSGRAFGQGSPIYFLNGLTGDHELFSLTNWLLREDFQSVVFDLPPDFRPRGAQELGTMLLAIADQHGHQSFNVFATGFGCVTAFAAMKTEPHRVRSAILQGAFATCSLSLTERLATRVGSILPGPLRSVPGALRIIRQNHQPWFPPFDTTRWSFAEERLSSTPIRSLARRALLLSGFDVSADCSAVTTPTMLVRCEGDSPIQVAAQDALESLLPAARVEWLHTCGRLPFLTHPHRLKGLFLDFCDPVAGS